MKEEDFFAPRPKLSHIEKVVRYCAVLYAIGVGVLFFALELLGLMMASVNGALLNWSSLAAGFFYAALLQCIILVPAWRCYLLRRWACIVITWLLILNLPCSLILAGTLGLSPLLLVLLAISSGYHLCGVYLLGCDWNGLKKGF